MPGYVWLKLPFTLGGGTRAQGVEVAIMPYGEITGRVLDSEGEPASMSRVAPAATALRTRAIGVFHFPLNASASARVNPSPRSSKPAA